MKEFKCDSFSIFIFHKPIKLSCLNFYNSISDLLFDYFDMIKYFGFQSNKHKIILMCVYMNTHGTYVHVCVCVCIICVSVYEHIYLHVNISN